MGKGIVRYHGSASLLDIQETALVDVVTFNSRSINPLLFQLLSIMTPSGHEQNIIPRITRMIKNMQPELKTHIDVQNNLILEIGERGKDHATMFSCHMDTVHHNQGILSLVMTNKNNKDGAGFIYGATRVKGGKLKAEVLGADDRAGIYIMLRMIKNSIPGLYVFHTWEEAGAKGSKHILDNCPTVYEGIKRCIAFDRRGYTDVITTQRGQRCCSDAFGAGLAKAINDKMTAKKSPYTSGVVGMFTDSATYLSKIPECTNISVGYFDQHTDHEYLDYVFLESILLPALLQVEWEKLPTERDPAKTEYKTYQSTWQERSSTYSTESYSGSTYLKPGHLLLSDIMPNGTLVNELQLTAAIDRLLEDFRIVKRDKIKELSFIIQALYLRGNPPIELTAADEIGADAAAEAEVAEVLAPVVVTNHGPILPGTLVDQMQTMRAMISTAITMYRTAVSELELNDEFKKVFEDTVVRSEGVVDRTIQMWREHKIPIERVLKDELEVLVSFIMTCGFMQNKTYEMAAIIEDVITTIVAVSDKAWVRDTSLTRFAKIPERAIVLSEDNDNVLDFISPCIKRCHTHELNACSGCGRTSSEKHDWDRMSISDKESTWIASRLRLYAYKDMSKKVAALKVIGGTDATKSKIPVTENATVH